jgi:hypothetical protein
MYAARDRNNRSSVLVSIQFSKLSVLQPLYKEILELWEVTISEPKCWEERSSVSEPNCGAQDTVVVPPFQLKASLEMVDRTCSPTT